MLKCAPGVAEGNTGFRLEQLSKAEANVNVPAEAGLTLGFLLVPELLPAAKETTKVSLARLLGQRAVSASPALVLLTLKGDTRPKGHTAEGPVTVTETDKDDTDTFLFRAMAVGTDGFPAINLPGEPIFAKHLGAKPNDLVNLIDEEGFVSPDHLKGGMSTSLVPEFVPNIMEDIKKGKKSIFKIKVSDVIKAGLLTDPDGGSHVSIQPGVRMSIDSYQSLIKSTRMKWMLHKN